MKMNAEQFGQELARILKDAMRPLGDRIQAVEDRLAAIETTGPAKGLTFKGAWQAALSYEKGDMATYAGALWHCNMSTQDRPGDGRAWTLAVKQGTRE